MKLIIEATSKNSMGAVHDLVDEQRFVIARCGTTEDAQEIVRRVNAHDALVAALVLSQELFEKALPQFNWADSALNAGAVELLVNVPREVKAALALAEKGER